MHHFFLADAGCPMAFRVDEGQRPGATVLSQGGGCCSPWRKLFELRLWASSVSFPCTHNGSVERDPGSGVQFKQQGPVGCLSGILRSGALEARAQGPILSTRPSARPGSRPWPSGSLPCVDMGSTSESVHEEEAIRTAHFLLRFQAASLSDQKKLAVPSLHP